MRQHLDNLTLPQDLRKCDVSTLQKVADELRDELIDSVGDSGGHFASSLGVTELTVALHACFNTPYDRIVWDVGHQCYIHKMLTGRREALSGVRQKDGISGFLKREESEYDTFGAGHAGTSISAAVGMAVASATLKNPRKVVAVIGDGSITAGMALEALNHAGDLNLSNLVVVLNDNDMSIAPNVGAMSWLFSQAVTADISNKARQQFKSLHRKGYIPQIVYKAIDRAEEATQGWMSPASMLFESFGFRYIGHVDGHDMGQLTSALQRAIAQDVPVLVHVRTKKGAGFQPAEKDPVKWHAVKPFDRNKGTFRSTGAQPKTPPTYTEVFSDTLRELARKDEDVVAITAAMPGGTGVTGFQQEFPDRTYDVGICEQHAVTFAAGLATEGKKPVVAIYSTFLQRGFDQVLHDVGIQKLPVVFAMDRAGVVGNDGETHQGVFDLSYLRIIPDMVISAPRDENQLKHHMATALAQNGPSAVRYPRGAGQGIALDPEPTVLQPGKGEVLRDGEEVLFLCLGPVTYTALAAAQQLSDEHGISASVVDMHFAKPLDEALLKELVPRHRVVCTLEDHSLTGGFSSAVLETCADLGLSLNAPLIRFGVPDKFVPHATQGEQYKWCGYDKDSVVQVLSELLKKSRLANG